MSAAWVIAPILLPFFAGGVLLLLGRRGLRLQRLVALAATGALAALAAALFVASLDGETLVYRLGDWPVPFGIVLAFDRLAGLMLLLTAVVGLFSLLHAVRGADTAGPFYHPLFQLQLVGLNGAFLTGDLFNLFVFFEILLIASYCLLVYGGTTPRLRAGIHYVVLNLVGSSLFLIAVGLLYGLTGALNMADLAGKVALLPEGDAALVRAAALLLLVVFTLKAAVVPLYFWLPGAYAAASAPVAALFAIMTKVGIYSILRVSSVIFGPTAGVAAGVFTEWVLPLALVTLALGMIGALACRELRRMQGYLLIGSIGVMLAGLAAATPAAVAAGLYYLVHSTLVTAAMFLLTDLIARQRGGMDDLLVPGAPLHQPATLGAMFFAGSVAVIGLPPLSGFLGKAWILQATIAEARMAWIWALVLAGGLLSLLALSRAGIVVFWQTDPEREAAVAARWSPAALAPAAGLLATVLLITVLAGPLAEVTRQAAEQVLSPEGYVSAVLGGGSR